MLPFALDFAPSDFLSLGVRICRGAWPPVDFRAVFFVLTVLVSL